MALIICPECGKKFSDTASACPSCGYQHNTVAYAKNVGLGIKEGLKGLNTTASPKKRKVCIFLILIPLILFLLFFAIGILTDNDFLMYTGLGFGFCLGLYQFYVGKIKRGILYTITLGGFLIGSIIDLFKLLLTKTFKDSNGFPLIY